MTARTSGVQIQNSSNKKSDSQDALSLQIPLPQLLDLALGTPEVGAVNLNILHNFLHVLLHQINLRNTKVEFRGEEANRIKTVINNSKVGPSLQLHEYNIITDPSTSSVQRKRGSESRVNADVYTNIEAGQDSLKSVSEEKIPASAPVTARGRNGSQESRISGGPGAKKTRASKVEIGAGNNGERQSVIFVEPVVNGVAPTALGFKKLEETVTNLEQRFQALDDLANNPEMIQRVKSSKGDPLSDMWHVININKRLDACEQGIEKLTTMTQDLIKGDNVEQTGSGSEELDRLNQRIGDVENQLAYLGGDLANLKNATSPGEIPQADPVHRGKSVEIAESLKPPGNNAEESSIVLPIPKQSERSKAPSIVDVKSPDGKTVSSAAISKPKLSQPRERHSVIGGIDLTDLKIDVGNLKNEMVEVRRNVDNLNSKMADVSETIKSTLESSNIPVKSEDSNTYETATAQSAERSDEPKYDRSGAAVSSNVVHANESLPVKKESLSKESSKVADSQAIGNQSATSNRLNVSKLQISEGSLRELESRISELEKEIGCVNEKLNVEALSSLAADGNGGIGDLIEKVLTIQKDMDKINVTASRLIDEKENREFHTDALIEQIELLKTIKADKEDLEEALADKADAQAVNRKVSHDQFDAACDDLARGLEDAITKLSQQESVWQEALDEVQREIEGKLDKIEISPLKEFVNNRLKLLQEKLKALAVMRRENEAAGTKKMLSDVQCISCDSNAVMKMEESSHYRAPILRCTKSIKPYLTYELDQVRKQQRKLPHSRNMLQFEAAMQEMAKRSKPFKEELTTKSPRDHLCNRYCGGSHTTTTPQQRVMRMGHFLNQWGPETIQLTEGLIRGNDGQLYRSRPMPGKPVTTGTSGEEQKLPEMPPATPSSPGIPGSPSVSHRESQSIRERSNESQMQKRSSVSVARRRSSVRRVSEVIKEEKKEEIPVEPSTPPGAPPGTVVDDAEMIPEPSGVIEEVAREVSIGDAQEEEEETFEEMQG